MKIKDLQTRYNLKSRKSIYDWCKAVNIELHKDSLGHAYATDEQIKKLDQLNEHLKNDHATLANFTPISAVTIEPINTSINTPIDTSINTLINSSDHPPESLILLEDIIGKIIDHVKPQDPLHYMTVLERAAASQWILSTSEVTQLIKVKPRTKGDDKVFIRGCWCFTKCGKIGNETGWKVMKKVENVNYKV